MSRARIREWAARGGPVLLTTAVGIAFSLWVLSGGYSGLEGTSINLRFQLRNKFSPWTVPSDQIVFVDINDAALESNLVEPYKTPRRWPWPRSVWAELHYLFKDCGIKPAAVVYDIVFDLADPELIAPRAGYEIQGAEDQKKTCDQVFQEALQITPEIPVFLASIFRPQEKRPFSRAEYASAKTSSDSPERDRRIWQPLPQDFTRFGIPYRPEVHAPIFHAREVSFPWDTKWWCSTVKDATFEDLEFMGLDSSLLTPAAGSGATTMNPESDGITRWAPLFFEYDKVLYPSLPMQMVLQLFGTPFEKVRFEHSAVVLPKPDGSEVRIPVDERKRLLLNFRFHWAEREKSKGFGRINFWRLANALDQLRSQIQAGGNAAPKGTFDARDLNGKILVVGSSAEGTHDLRATPIDERYPMMGTIGEIIRSIQQQDFLRMAPPWLNALWIIGGTFLIGLLGQFLAPIKHAVATLAVAGAHALSAYFLFVNGNVIVDFFHVSIAEIVAYAVVTITQYMQVSSIFGRYVSPGVRRYLLSNRKALELGGQETEVSIIFSDLSGFTSMSEKMQAPEVIATLNEYFAPMFKIIIDGYGGTLDKLIGDAIMAYYGHPQPESDHPLRAVSAALEMQRKLTELRKKWEAEGKPPIRMRIGVNTGTVVAGNMGDSGRTDYSIIGDNVNLASRLESNAPVDGVLISETTYERVKDHFIFKEREPIKVKGKEKPVKVYEVLDFAGGKNKARSTNL